MACRSVNNLRFSRENMRRIFREQARTGRGGVKIRHIIQMLDILGPLIPQFFCWSDADINVDGYNSCNTMNGGYSGKEDMSFHNSDRYGMVSENTMDEGYHGHGMSYGNTGNRRNAISRADDYGDQIISEEEFERLLDYAEQRINTRIN